MTIDGPVALYRHFTVAGRLLYVGITSNVKRRNQAHKERSAWWPEVARTAVEWYPSRALADGMETIAVAVERPVHNNRKTSWLQGWAGFANRYLDGCEVTGSQVSGYLAPEYVAQALGIAVGEPVLRESALGDLQDRPRVMLAYWRRVVQCPKIGRPPWPVTQWARRRPPLPVEVAVLGLNPLLNVDAFGEITAASTGGPPWHFREIVDSEKEDMSAALAA